MVKSTVLLSRSMELQPFSDRYLTPRYVDWLNDKTTVRYSEQRHRTHSLESCRAYAHSFERSPHFFWALISTDPIVEHIGNLTAMVDLPNQVADLAILIGETSARGKGVGFAAWQLAMNFLLGEGNMRKVTAGTMASNLPMLHVMQKSGMIEEGRRRRQFLHEGVETDLVMFAKFASHP
jgi:[ribosomal protein S5]-alanine N-acetyltransferase